MGKHTVRNSDDVKEPEQVQSLQHDEKTCGDVLADPALVLLGFPVELKGADRAESREEGPDDLEVDEMAEIDPHTHEHCVERCNRGMI